MKKKMWILPVVGAMALTICLSACDNKTPSPTVPDDSNVETTAPNNNTPDATNPSVDVVEPNIQNTTVVAGEQFIWDKEYDSFKATDIVVNKDWADYITLDGQKMYTTNMMDMSALNNCFYNDNLLGIVDDMKMAYELGWRDLRVSAETIAPNDLANGLLTVKSSTYPTTETVLETYSRNLVVDSIQYDSYVAEHEDVVTAFKDIHVEEKDSWGIGSTYDEVVAIMGAPTVEFADDVFEHSILTTATYQSEHCIMTITFFTDTAAEKGFVVGLTWTPTTINDTVCRQDGYNTLYSGLYSEMTFNTNDDTTTDESNADEPTNDVVTE